MQDLSVRVCREMVRPWPAVWVTEQTRRKE